ncbi:unnamed protein product [Rotaria sp. Silwood2]|nr:unnamed protein product [Rotaria sp. Silwood2]CAF2630013.1 unnamed protein product [Rotaria sp. Silwood2]CAF2880548.1 unnamed protein product [Rotaria sp. Silwood2]CAF3042968.1 unnamed protein product [Rotaria sp. Silwood2]CAF4059268.1 unnamed protein product [Rotaria sp. Silwood2]
MLTSNSALQFKRQKLTLSFFNCTFYLGTEAAAAAVVMLKRYGSAFGGRSSSIEFKANRPFLFFIHEVQQNIVLFSGKLVSPEPFNN